LVDSAGFEEFGLTHLSFDQIAATFPEFGTLLGHCRFQDCRHLREPGCAVRTALEDGRVMPERYEFYRSLVSASLA
jgi:ribosome biogenesis GTPase